MDGTRKVCLSRYARRGWKLLPAVLMVLGVMFWNSAAVRADAPWRVGFARAEITPDEPVPMSGYKAREDPSKGVLHPLYARAMAIEDAAGAGRRAVLVTAEICILHRSYADTVAKQIMSRTGLQREQILLNVTHTHSGPFCGKEGSLSYKFSDELLQRASDYRKRLRKELVSVAEKALKDMKPARLAWGMGVAHFVMNRREFTERGVRLGVNPRGYADRSVPVLRVTSPDGSLRGVVFGYACHATTLGINYELSGDYPGVAQHYIEDERPGVHAMFVTGCGGSANPYPRPSLEDTEDHGRELGHEVLEVIENGDLASVNGPLRLVLEDVTLPLQSLSKERLEQMVEHTHYHPHNARRMLKALEQSESIPDRYSAPVAVWQFGDDLTFLGLAGEVVGEYVPLIEETVGHRKLWIAAYCNEVYGYLPTARVLREGGYETRGTFIEKGYFAEDAETALLDKVQELAREAGRPSELSVREN